ncbi:MAG: UDP-3-O-(3-hydroxymyristoyl)glucosamine N-acyltransferase [Vampirovibrionales bacterium]|nr:UDP-3-O-(3-hydroxymyristoyl)glucosamine N-acyltransferase [Vampirovibrionales bacterium]
MSLPVSSQPRAKTLAELADATGGRIEGDASQSAIALAHPQEAGDPRAMVVLLDADVAAKLAQAGARFELALAPEALTLPEGLVQHVLRVPRPRHALAILLKLFDRPPSHSQGVHPTALIDSSARLAADVCIGAYCVVGPDCVMGARTILLPHVTLGANVTLGDDCLLYSGARVYDRVTLGDRVTLHANVCIGADGFSYVTPEAGSVESARASGGRIEARNTDLLKINSVGSVIIGDDVEVGAGATIDRANLGATRIGRGTKIDNLAMIGHNNTIGENCLIVSQVGVSGSCRIGDRVVLAGQAGIKDHTTIGDDAIVMAKSGVMADVAAKTIVAGLPARPQREAFQQVALIGRLPEMRQELTRLKKRTEALEQALLETLERLSPEGGARV